MNDILSKNIRLFDSVLEIIRHGQSRAYQSVNHILLETYWQIGGFLAEQVREQNCIIMAQCKTPEEREYYLKSFTFSSDADLLSFSLFGKIAKDWKEHNPAAKEIER